MANKFEFEAQLREQHGTAAMRRMRLREDKIPAILYGAGKSATSISLSHNMVSKAFEQEAVFSHILTLKLPNETEKVVLKAVARHPSCPRILHIDFLRINMSEKLIMRVPLHFMGEEKAPGLKDGGVLSKLMSDVEVSCFPDQLPEYIGVDISHLNMRDSVHLSTIQLPQGVDLAHPITDAEHDRLVITIQEPRAEEPEATAVTAEAGAEGAEGAVAPAEGAEKAEAGAAGDAKPGKSDAQKAESKKSEEKKPEAKK